MESDGHLRLKHVAVALLRQRGYRAVAMEVRCPAGRFRADVAGYREWRDDDAGTMRVETCVIECKRSRSDFLRDGKAERELLARKAKLEAQKAELERGLVRRLEPHLRRSGSSLFAELEEWDYGASRSIAYRSVRAELEAVERKLYGQTKFARLARYASADRLWVMATRGVVRDGEIPSGWGLIEWRAGPDEGERRPADPDTSGAQIRETREAPALGATDRRRRELLRNIAQAASSTAWPGNPPGVEVSGPQAPETTPGCADDAGCAGV